MKQKNPYRKTVMACYLGYISQALVVNFVPMLFVTFQSGYGIPLVKITALITVCFVLQLFIDFASAFFVDRIGYRATAVLGNALAAAGFLLLTVLPEVCRDPFVGLLAAVLVYSAGSGLLEVIVSPIVEACPGDNKEGTMSLLHSFYCWGCVGVVALSSLFFTLVGIENWKILAGIWAILPLANSFLFARVPIAKLEETHGEQLPLKTLVKNRLFWLVMLLMLCAGACEQAVCQWSSAFVERALGIPKSFGDLVGPGLFALTMGTSRALYGKFSSRLRLEPAMFLCCLLCIVSYGLISLTQNPLAALAGIGLCGFSVGIMWPGTFSMAAASVKGGSAMFAFLALAGDLGCAAGPSFVGFAAGVFGDNLKIGILFALIFPVLMAVLAAWKNRRYPWKKTALEKK